MATDAPKPMRRIALMNQKGGVGKTTTTVNLAAGIAARGRPTLLVDLDPQAHATLHLGLDPAELNGSVYDALSEPGVDPTPLVTRARENLDILPAETDLAGLETELADAPDRQQRLNRLLDRLAGRYEFVLLDCPPSLGTLTINALVAAREVFIPMQAHFLALQGVGKLLETVQLVGQAANPRLRVTGVILCMYDAQTTHTQEVVADLEGFFEEARSQETAWKSARVYRPPVRRNVKLAECPSFGQTIFEYAPGAAGATDYAQLAETVVREWDLMLSRRTPGAAKGEGGSPEQGGVRPVDAIEPGAGAAIAPGTEIRVLADSPGAVHESRPL